MGQFDLHCWYVRSWRCGTGPGSHEFSIQVSPEFLEGAKETDFDEGALQLLARISARQAGYPIVNSRILLHFGEYGLQQIDAPGGGGRWLALGPISEINLQNIGGQYSSHNIDNGHQQSLLFAIWLKWAEVVEETIKERRLAVKAAYLLDPEINSG